MAQAKGKLRHLALSVPDPEKAAEFYMSAFGMEKVTSVKAPMADGVYLTDGTDYSFGQFLVAKIRIPKEPGRKVKCFKGLDKVRVPV